jgi:hypothetical protein
MNQLFILYTVAVIICISVLFFAYKFTFEKKILKWKEWGFITIGMILLTIGTLSFRAGKEVNDKLCMKINLPNDAISTMEQPGDTTLTIKKLYNFLLDMRAPFPEVMTCQALHESTNFTSPLYRRQSNMFGMKSSYERPSVGDNNKVYQDYKGDWQKSVVDYVLWVLKNRVDQLSESDYIEYLGKRYAEDPLYKEKIRKQLKNINFKKLKNQ